MVEKGASDVHITVGVESHATAERYLQIDGAGEVCQDPAELKAFWAPPLAKYFEGPEDPNYALIVVRPARIELWSMGSKTPETWERG